MPACIFSTLTSSPSAFDTFIDLIPAASLCLLTCRSFKSPPPYVSLCPPGSAVSLPAHCQPLCPSPVPVPAPLRCQRLSILTATAAPPLISLPLLHPSTLLTRWPALFYIDTTHSSRFYKLEINQRCLREHNKYQTSQFFFFSFLEFCLTFSSIYVSYSVSWFLSFICPIVFLCRVHLSSPPHTTTSCPTALTTTARQGPPTCTAVGGVSASCQEMPSPSSHPPHPPAPPVHGHVPPRRCCRTTPPTALWAPPCFLHPASPAGRFVHETIALFPFFCPYLFLLSSLLASSPIFKVLS